MGPSANFERGTQLVVSGEVGLNGGRNAPDPCLEGLGLWVSWPLTFSSPLRSLDRFVRRSGQPPPYLKTGFVVVLDPHREAHWPVAE